jgi:hypothetical protein
VVPDSVVVDTVSVVSPRVVADGRVDSSVIVLTSSQAMVVNGVVSVFSVVVTNGNAVVWDSALSLVDSLAAATPILKGTRFNIVSRLGLTSTRSACIFHSAKDNHCLIKYSVNKASL